MKVSDYLSRDEVAYFTSKSDWHAWRLVVFNWAFIAAIFATVGAFPNPLTIVAGIVLLGGRQLGLSVLMHDCGHRTLFRTQWLNDVVGQWLCALPVLNDQPSYARGHLEHHRKAGTREDPDLPNYQAYPVSRESFRRKVVRDLTGQTGFKLVSFILRGASGIISSERRASSKPFVQQIIVQLALFGILWASGIGWTYLLWVVAFMTVFMLIVRIRQVAEHAAVPDLYDMDPRNNTRTVDAPWWQRMIFAPNGVNFHMEHHFMASVPCYRLGELRAHLRNKRALDGVPVFRGYGQLLRHAVATP
ncbi:MAG: fatty acid desaturase family protein [Halioglobus sp.]|nr:fatty acid desaturase family protein [Halioglobus sp.]